MDKTPKLNLNIPRGNDYVDIDVLGQNFEIIDEKLGENIERTNENLHQINTLSDRVTTIENELSDQQELTTTLKYGSQVIEVPRDTPFNVLSLKGRTLVNLLGTDGNCESLTPFTTAGTAPTLSTTQKKSGNNSIKCSASNTISYVYKDYDYKLDTSKYYLIGVWIYIESWTSGSINFTLCDRGTFTWRYQIDANTGKIGQWQFIYGRISNNNTITTNGFRMLLGITGASTATAYFDDAFIYEIDQATYNKIDVDPEYTGDKLAEKFPYVDSVQAIQNPYVIRRSRNLIPPFTQWNSGNIEIDIKSPYEAILKSTSTSNLYRYIDIPVKGGQTYTYSVTKSGNGVFAVFEYKNGVFNNVSKSTPSATWTLLNDTTHLRLELNNNLMTGDTTFTNPMLNLGSTALPFEPFEEDYLFLETKLHSSVDGTVYDELLPTDTGHERLY